MQQASSSKASNLISKVKQSFSSGKHFTSCADLPLYNFIKILVHNELEYLIISGYPSVKKLEDSWENIFSEYLALTNDTQQTILLNCLKEITSLTNKLILVQAMVNHLSKNYHYGLVMQLKSLGFRFSYDPNSDNYQKELKLTVSQSKTLLFRIDQRKRELEAMQTKKGVTESDYDTLLSELGRFQGYPINKKETTVSEFIALVKRFKEANKQPVK